MARGRAKGLDDGFFSAGDDDDDDDENQDRLAGLAADGFANGLLLDDGDG